jgi:AcrR family transcriptional regulator
MVREWHNTLSFSTHFLSFHPMNDVQPYHHGRLREALIDAACEAVARDGYESLSLRALAEEMGVARSAPYRHFPEKDGLLAEVATRGFDMLAAQLDAIAAAELAPRARLIATGQSFLAFVRDNPQLFRLMYEARLLSAGEVYPALAQAQSHSYVVLDALYQQYAPEPQAARRQLRMITLWSTLYGYAKVRQAGILQPYMISAVSEAQIDAAVLDAMLGGT